MKQASDASTSPPEARRTSKRGKRNMSSSKGHNVYGARNRSKSSVSYAETNKANKASTNSDAPSSVVKHFNDVSPNNLSSSLINAFQMPQNIANALPTVFPNINMSSLPDYLPQLPSVSMPTMANISRAMPSIPSLSMPSMPNLSMPNITMPSIPSISNINIPSFSEIMNFPLRKNIKSWNQICSSVRESRKRFNDACPSQPFSFTFCYDHGDEKLRIYFLASLHSCETTLFYCDVPLHKDTSGYIFETDEDVSFASLNGSNELETSGESETKRKKIPKYGNNLSGYVASFEQEDIEEEDSDFEMGNTSNGSKSSSSLHSLSSSPSNESYTSDPTLLRKSVSSPNSSMPEYKKMEWKPLLLMNRAYYNFNDESPDLVKTSKQAKSDSQTQSKSREEDLIMQRKRILTNGVSSYDFCPSSARFVFTIKNVIYWFDDGDMLEKRPPRNTGSVQLDRQASSSNSFNLPNLSSPLFSSAPYIPIQFMNNPHVKTNAKICPYNADLVAYLADNDLWVCDLISLRDIRLTNTKYTETAIKAGCPSFVMQEEFGRYTGFWWRPTVSTKLGDTFDSHAILCEFVDESAVDPFLISNWDGTSEHHRFPKAGGANAKSTLQLVQFSFESSQRTLNNTEPTQSVKTKSLPASLEALFPEYEYLIRCDWHSSDIIWAQLLNRRQDKLAMVFIPLDNQFEAQIIYEESRSDHWYNCHDVLYFYHKFGSYFWPDGSAIYKTGSEVRFLWSSEADGYRHLYLVTVRLADSKFKRPEMDEMVWPSRLKNSSSNPDGTSQQEMETETLIAVLTSHEQLTSGRWEIIDSNFWVDEDNELIYFLATKDSPLESHLYVIPSNATSSRVAPRRLTKEDFTHTRILFDPQYRFCIDFQSNLSVPPFSFLHEIIEPQHAPGQLVKLEPMYYFQAPSQEDVTFDESQEYFEKVQTLGPTPQLFEYKLESGELMYGFLFKPDLMEPGAKYPVLLEIYGGPEVQLVSKSFKDVRQHKRHLIASEGYVVVAFDSRGSKYRGVNFERHIYKRLGQVEIQDQVEALEWLAENTGFIDMNRVAIHGWSYGGYLSLQAIAQRPDIFKCAIAGAPVTNWLLYDTGYTERYMGLPEENEEAYRLSNVLTYSKQFPDEPNRLLIIHGLMDENVHYAHTVQLINCLIMLGKPYNLNVFPFERHSLRKMYSSEHYEATLLYYLQQNL